jgi:hypothetical protein
VSADTPAPWASLVDALRADSPIAVLEQSERQLKQILSRELAGPLDGPRIRALASFQRDLGFLLKYKSYAVKAASPLGYSVFLQRPGEGFSFSMFFRADSCSCAISPSGSVSTSVMLFWHGWAARVTIGTTGSGLRPGLATSS